MGQNESKPNFRRSASSTNFRHSETPPLPRRNSSPSLKTLGSNKKTIQQFSDTANYLIARVNSFNGTRGDVSHQQLEQEIVNTSTRLQEFRRTLKKDSERSALDKIQRIIGNCLATVIEKTKEGSESPPPPPSITVEAPPVVELRKPQKVHKHQFKRPPKRTYDVYTKRNGRLRSLAQIEKAVYELKEDAISAIRVEDERALDNQLAIVKKIGTDLEMIETEKYTPLCETKESLFKTVVKINGNLKKAKKKLLTPTVVDAAPAPKKELLDLEQNLQNMETQIQTLRNIDEAEVLKTNLKQDLRKAAEIDEEEGRKLTVLYKINQLLERIEQTELAQIQQQLDHLKPQISDFASGNSTPEYVSLDQSLRKLWANLGKIDGDVHGTKTQLISDIQQQLQSLTKKGKENASPRKEKTNLGEILDSICKQSVASTDKLREEELDQSEVDEVKEKLDQLRRYVDVMLREVSEQETKLKEASVEVRRKEPVVEEKVTRNSSLSVFEKELRRKQMEIIKRYDDEVPQKLPSKKHEELVVREVLPERNYATVTTVEEKPQLSSDVLDYKPEKDTSHIRTLGQQINDNTVYYNFTDRKPKEIDDIKTRLPEIRKGIADFKGTSKNDDYHVLENECLRYLHKINRTANSKATVEIIEQISATLDELDLKLTDNQNAMKRGRGEIKSVVERVQNLKRRVDNFNGSYMNILYVQIENALRQEFRNVSRIDPMDDGKLEQAVEQTKQKIQQYIKILEEKSQKSEVASQQQTSSLTPLEEIQSVFDETSRKIDNFNGNHSDKLYAELEETLISLVIRLDKIPLTNPEVKQQRRNLIQNIRSYTKILDGKARREESPVPKRSRDLESIWEEFQNLQRLFNCPDGVNDEGTYGVVMGKLRELLRRAEEASGEDEDVRRRCTDNVGLMMTLLQEKFGKRLNYREVVV